MLQADWMVLRKDGEATFNINMPYLSTLNKHIYSDSGNRSIKTTKLVPFFLCPIIWPKLNVNQQALMLLQFVTQSYSCFDVGKITGKKCNDNFSNFSFKECC